MTSGLMLVMVLRHHPTEGAGLQPDDDRRRRRRARGPLRLASCARMRGWRG
ncbi:hypothetical protein [Cellulomonas sp. ATA003]|uniref:hypothetical protein n=1 Tax=Cellulomonas sp. ATA003 TaxID=3073064 RepID=UPI002872B85E|nr:hypothetical protein [Cellulomonas sp. ATA003]WNB87068.1 hypothetical protein REH70_08065 [Cellulomonas sp. ATA003]